MSSIPGLIGKGGTTFGKGGLFNPDIKTPKLPPEVELLEKVNIIEEEASKAARRKRKKFAKGGRKSTILSGIQSALKRRLGE